MRDSLVLILRILKSIKPWIQRIVPVLTLIFLGLTLRAHGREAVGIAIPSQGWLLLSGSLGITALAHVCSGWAWGLILALLQCSPPPGWSIQIYLKTNLAKYLPGNIWHFYGRIQAATQLEIPLGIAALSVGLEPILMLAAALMLILLVPRADLWLLQLLGLGILLGGIHPRILNQVIPWLLSKTEGISTEADPVGGSHRIQHYPWIPLLAELLFVVLRGLGFCLALSIFFPWSWRDLPLLLSSFSLAWVLGLIVPGAPGGLGVFEASIVLLLESTFSPGPLLNGVALYRISSLLAEALGAGLASIIPCRLPVD